MWEWRTIARSPADASPAVLRAPSCMADGEEVQRPLEAPLPEAEVPCRDRRREAVIEGLGQSEALMEGVPPDPDRELVCAQLAGVEEAEQLDAVEVAVAELAELRLAVLLEVPGV